MVLDFGKEHYKMGSDQLASLSKAVQNGDISVVMKAYEHELKVRYHFLLHLLSAYDLEPNSIGISFSLILLDTIQRCNLWQPGPNAVDSDPEDQGRC